MLCGEYRAHLLDYIRHILSRAEADEMVHHLAHCQGCREEFRRLYAHRQHAREALALVLAAIALAAVWMAIYG